MLEVFSKHYIRDGRVGAEEALSIASNVQELIQILGGASFSNGLYRVIRSNEKTEWDLIVAQTFPAFGNRLSCFAYDWLGRIFSLDTEREIDGLPGVLMLEPSTGQGLEIPSHLASFHDDAIIHELTAAGKDVFLDLKLFEIPNSVASAVKAAGLHGVKMVTVHAFGGLDILRAAVKAAEPFPEMKILALTVVTSLQDKDLKQVGVQSSVDEQVVRLAELADIAGCHGVVASAHEAKILKKKIRPGMFIITPGIQLDGEESTDQIRVTTPRKAFEAGATHIMIGRSITKASDPGAVFNRVCAELGV